MSQEFEIQVTEGPLKGRSFAVPAEGLRLGRLSACEISIPDPALSRTHCLFEAHDGALWVTDLASANGTVVNDEQLGADSHRLKSGDKVFVGDSVILVVAKGDSDPAPDPVPVGEAAMPTIDLGLSGGEKHQEEAAEARPQSGRRFILWGVALAFAGAAAALFLIPVGTEPESAATAPLAEEADNLVSFTFEKVKADTRSAYRYALVYDGKSMRVEVDDVPEASRHVREMVELSDDARKRLADIFASPELHILAPEHVGNPAEPGSLQSFSLHAISTKRVLDISVENKVEPEAFQDMRLKLEAFADSELGLHAIHMPVAKLKELSAEARRVADAKWAERESGFGNLAEALRKYDEAIHYLKTVDPKPADYEETCSLRKMVKDELDRVYMLHRGNADQAIGTQNWEQAKYELHVLLELVNDPNDERNKEASRKLLEVEARMKAKR